MIRIDKYQKSVEEKYWECVKNVIPQEEQIHIVNSCSKFLPSGFFSKSPCFKELVLAPYDKIKTAYEYIRENPDTMDQECFACTDKLARKPLYDKLYAAYEKVSQCMIDKTKMNVMLVQSTGLTVCPYCNRDYINCRSETLSGAQLDHFYPRSRYPAFSLCLYNLVPVCGNCNRIKGNNTEGFVSPFDEEIDWDKELRFSYRLLDTDRIEVIINVEKLVEKNINALEIEKAYQIHDMEVKELLYKVKMYSHTQLKEFKELLRNAGLKEQEIKHMVFGPSISEEDIKKKPLGRMLRDLERELDVYT